MKTKKRLEGFTLVELLIVIAIIGILAGLAMQGISAVRESTSAAMTTTDIQSLRQAIEQYVQDEGIYPGQDTPSKKFDEELNDFPKLYNALFGEKKPDGPGGRNAPYSELSSEKIAVYDEEEEIYRVAKRSELDDVDVDKFVLDAWGEPLIYRCNKGRKREPFMRNKHSFDLYSMGPDSENQTIEGDDEVNDDIGNW